MAALLPLLLLSVVGGDYSLFRCQLTGVASAEGCCPGERGERAPGADRADEARAAGATTGTTTGATIGAAACCTRETVAVSLLPSEPSPNATPHDLGFPPSILCVADVPAPGAGLLGGRRISAADRDGPPQTPILLAKRTLLI